LKGSSSDRVNCNASEKETDSDVFDIGETYYLYDVDFFDLNLNDKRHLSYRDDVRDLVAVIKELVVRNIGKKCDDSKEVRRIFSTYIEHLPNSRAIWRLRLFTLSQCPKVFKNELKDAFFRLFSTDHYHEIEGGTEYKKALKIGFGELSDKDKREYIARVLKYFEERSKKDPDQGWHKRHGWEILSSICNHLTPDEKEKCEQAFGAKCDSDFEPIPIVSGLDSGFSRIKGQAPENLQDFSIKEIIENLAGKWSPTILKEKYKEDDFHAPRGAEGLGDALKDDLKKRFSDYLENAVNFFDRQKIHPHYTYSFLLGIEEMLRGDSMPDDIDTKKTF